MSIDARVLVTGVREPVELLGLMLGAAVHMENGKARVETSALTVVAWVASDHGYSRELYGISPSVIAHVLFHKESLSEGTREFRSAIRRLLQHMSGEIVVISHDDVILKRLEGERVVHRRYVDLLPDAERSVWNVSDLIPVPEE